MTTVTIITIAVILVILAVYSYLWIDLAIVLMLGETKPFLHQLDSYRNLLGPNRQILADFFLILIFALTLAQIWLLLSKPKFTRRQIIISLIILLLPALSYPFLSSDIFSYLFSAKIAYVYQMNPYTVIPETFRNKDLWLGFTYWTHRPYIYGPAFLLYSIIPIVISSGKRFIIAFFGMKIMNFILFLLAGYQLLKAERQKSKILALWFFNPLLLTELLINSHNEIVMISLFIIAYALIKTRHKVWGWITFLTSILIKYISILLSPLLFLRKTEQQTFFCTGILVMLLLYLGIKFPSVQAWYYSWIYLALPFTSLTKQSLVAIFIFQFLLLWDKYYTFILTGGWNQPTFVSFIQLAAILLPISIIIFERKNISKFLKGAIKIKPQSTS